MKYNKKKKASCFPRPIKQSDTVEDDTASQRKHNYKNMFIALIVTLLIAYPLTIWFCLTRTCVNENKNDTKICMVCWSLVKNPYNLSEPDHFLDNLTRKQMDNVNQCCAETPEQKSTMLEMIKRGQDVKLEPLIQITLPKSHVSAQVNMFSEHSSIDAPVSTFNNSYQEVLVVQRKAQIPGFQVLHDGVVILNTGFYSVNIRLSDVTMRKPEQRILVYVHRTQPNVFVETGVLLTSVLESTDASKKSTHASTDGTFLLKAGDFIQVFLSGKDLIDFHKSFPPLLGLTMISCKKESL